MNASSSPTSTSIAGLCGTCLHARQIRSGRGSSFLLCRRAADEPAFTRYPRLPVSACAGHAPEAVPSGAEDAASG